MYTPNGTYGEVCSLFVGFDNGHRSRVLGPFQGWLAERHPDFGYQSFFSLYFMKRSRAKELGETS